MTDEGSFPIPLRLFEVFRRSEYDIDCVAGHLKRRLMERRRWLGSIMAMEKFHVVNNIEREDSRFIHVIRRKIDKSSNQHPGPNISWLRSVVKHGEKLSEQRERALGFLKSTSSTMRENWGTCWIDPVDMEFKDIMKMSEKLKCQWNYAMHVAVNWSDS